jgi:hypothetical protein
MILIIAFTQILSINRKKSSEDLKYFLKKIYLLPKIDPKCYNVKINPKNVKKNLLVINKTI